MNKCWLRFELKSDASFGSGSGIPGLVDQDVLLDEWGCPYLHGRTLKGLLSESCADILSATSTSGNQLLKQAADRLFGRPGSTHSDKGMVAVGHARLPSDLREAIRYHIDRDGLTPEDVTHSLTAIRHQTALQSDGAPDPHSLRNIRVILRETAFEAQLTFDQPLDRLTPLEQGLLAACVKGLRRAGTARNRGHGRLTAWLEDMDEFELTSQWFHHFQAYVTEEIDAS
ncbi:MAG: RAMP superfamily CRISPR-associated protein [Chloroflexota bacterium]